MKRTRRLTHLDSTGAARMVDVGGKPVTRREAVAVGFIQLQRETIRAITAGKVPKGEVLNTARIAGILAAKQCGNLIPLCHPLALTSVKVALDCDAARSAVDVEATCKLVGRTGVEMEALTAASVAALTVYDMCKAIDRGMTITDVRLVHKSGGKSGTWEAR